jgi:XTP/dITP diphosphohydrolase
VKKLLLATRNEGKVAEMRSLLAGLDLSVVSASEIAELPEVEETENTLEGNAARKARLLFQAAGLPAIADDTGLEVDALGGRPGVHSARYAGPEEDPARNRVLLLREMAQCGARTARFRTVVAYVNGSGVRFFEGECRGRIAAEERGQGGFGYDSIFIPDGSERTFAEMSSEEKNRISHRGRALRKFRQYLAQQSGIGNSTA